MTDKVKLNRQHQIRDLNDVLRIRGVGGRTVISRGLAAIPADELAVVLRAVAAFTAFDERNDPHGEHDCALMEVVGHQVLWKIDTYDSDLRYLSPDAGDPDLTRRVLTIMLAGEY